MPSRKSMGITLLAVAGSLASASANSVSFTSEKCVEHETMKGASIDTLDVKTTELASCHEDPVQVRVTGTFDAHEAEVWPTLLVEMRAEGVLLSQQDLPFCKPERHESVDCVMVNSNGQFEFTQEFVVGEGIARDASRTIDAFLVSPSTHIVGCMWGRLHFTPTVSEGLKSSPLMFTKKEVETLFNRWVNEHGAPSTGSMEERMMNFEANLYEVARHNKVADPSFELALNQFATHSVEEYRKMLGYRPDLKEKQEVEIKSEVSRRLGEDAAEEARMKQLPTEWDWVSKGAVTPVKNQGSCGSCWSFSTTGAMEGAYFLKTGKLVSFSEQEMVSCDHVDLGCNGGLMDNAFKWIEKNGGLCSESDYPYVSGGGRSATCKKSNCTPVPGTVPKDFVDVKKNSKVDMMEAVAKQPVAIAIEADQLPFQFYRKGVLKRWCGTRLDHGVLLVGYGNYEPTGMDYWKVKNSWGPTWGAKGFLLIQRGKSQNGGECGILLSGSIPEL